MNRAPAGAPRATPTFPSPKVGEVGYMLNWPERSVTFIKRESQFQIKPTQLTIPIAMLDVVFHARLGGELANNGLVESSVTIPGGVPPARTPA